MGELTSDDVRLIKIMYEDGYTLSELAEIYHDVNPDRIQKIISALGSNSSPKVEAAKRPLRGQHALEHRG